MFQFHYLLPDLAYHSHLFNLLPIWVPSFCSRPFRGHGEQRSQAKLLLGAGQRMPRQTACIATCGGTAWMGVACKLQRSKRTSRRGCVGLSLVQTQLPVTPRKVRPQQNTPEDVLSSDALHVAVVHRFRKFNSDACEQQHGVCLRNGHLGRAGFHFLTTAGFLSLPWGGQKVEPCIWACPNKKNRSTLVGFLVALCA